MKYIIFFALLLFPLSAQTAVVSMGSVVNSDSQECKLGGAQLCFALAIDGKIEKGDSQKLDSEIMRVKDYFLKNRNMNARVSGILFNSPGGDLLEAMKIGRIIRREMMSTHVPEDSSCYSACVVGFVAGVTRWPVGQLGIHSFYSKDFIGYENFENQSTKYNEISLRLEDYLKEMRIPVALLDEMKKVPHYNNRVLNFDEMVSLGIIGVDPVFAQAMRPPNK
jgi:hypothetical protein